MDCIVSRMLLEHVFTVARSLAWRRAQGVFSEGSRDQRQRANMRRIAGTPHDQGTSCTKTHLVTNGDSRC